MIRLIAILILLSDTFCFAETRLFTDDSGRQIEAELVGMTGENVVLKRNGRLAQWPVSKLSASDQQFVETWNKTSPTSPPILIQIWERDGVGASGVINPEKLDPTALGKNIPMLKKTEEKGFYKHYDVDLNNRSAIDGTNLLISYVLYIVDAQNKVVGEKGKTVVELVEANGRQTVTTRAITYVRSKTTGLALSSNILGQLSVGTTTDKSTEKFGGAWVRVYSASGELLGEKKSLSDSLSKLDIPWTGDDAETQIQIPESFAQLEEFLGPLKELLNKLPELPEGLPKPSELPKPPAGLPKPPFGRP